MQTQQQLNAGCLPLHEDAEQISRVQAVRDQRLHGRRYCALELGAVAAPDLHQAEFGSVSHPPHVQLHHHRPAEALGRLDRFRRPGAGFACHQRQVKPGENFTPGALADETGQRGTVVAGGTILVFGVG